MARRPLSPGCSVLFMIPFMMAGCGIAVATGAQAHTSWRIVHDYEQSTCKVANHDYSAIHNHGHTTYYGVVHVELVLEGHTYSDDENVGAAETSSAAALSQIRAAYPMGESIVCFYDPEAPTEIALARSGTAWVPLAFFTALWNAFTYIALFVTLRRLLKARMPMG